MDILLHDPSSARDSVIGTTLDDLLNLLEVVGHLDTMPSICVLPRFDDPHVCIFSDILPIVPLELGERRFIHSIFDVERDRQRQVGVLAYALVVFLQIGKECLLVA